ncbi:MAG: type II toxin-antitoxin system RelE/ParE family toxin [Candidatus Berkiellales bacterium]
MDSIKRQIEIYCTTNGKKPFISWLESVKDKKYRYRIKERLDRIALGNMGDCKLIKYGIFELRCDFGPGYRIYFGEENKKIVILLCGGDKSTQEKDIKKAIKYWEEYLSR